jgi:hypothetical protein
MPTCRTSRSRRHQGRHLRRAQRGRPDPAIRRSVEPIRSEVLPGRSLARNPCSGQDRGGHGDLSPSSFRRPDGADQRSGSGRPRTALSPPAEPTRELHHWVETDRNNTALKFELAIGFVTHTPRPHSHHRTDADASGRFVRNVRSLTGRTRTPLYRGCPSVRALSTPVFQKRHSKRL